MNSAKVSAAVLIGWAGSACAQSSVTLYGVVDASVEYATHVGSVPAASNQFDPGVGNQAYRLDSGGLSGSRWGIRGLEDLGTGMKATFVLESGFGVDTGVLQQGGRLFGRQAFVGLQKAGIGQISFGRQYTSMLDVLANFAPAAYATQYEPVVLQSGANYREDNTLKYTGQFGPVTAVAHWSFGTGLALPASVGLTTQIGGSGEVPGQFRRDTAYGAAIAYAGGAFGATLAYDQWNPTIGTGSGTAKKAAAGVSYAIGDRVKVMGGYRWGQNRSQSYAVIQRDDFYWVGANYQASPAVNLTVEYNYDSVRNLYGNSGVANPWQVALMSSYTLSKRTDAYLTAAFARNAGVMMESLATLYANSLALGNSYVLGRGQSTMLGLGVGVRHKF